MVRSSLTVIALTFLAALGGCVSFPDAPDATMESTLAGNVFQTRDGVFLHYTKWPAENQRAIIVAIHGMNDYSNTYSFAADRWADKGITTYALDMRGFGESAAFGRWVGVETLLTDFNDFFSAVQSRHSETPIYVVGHSMGAGLVSIADARASLSVDGIVLAAPGFWGAEAMPLAYRISANVGAFFAPGKTLTGERAGRMPSNNIDVLRMMFRDPAVVKDTRLDAVLGVVRLMGEAYGAVEQSCTRALMLIGEKDEIIPEEVMRGRAAARCGDTTLQTYPDGWHLLFRDHQRDTVIDDVANWVLQPPVPSEPQKNPQSGG